MLLVGPTPSETTKGICSKRIIACCDSKSYGNSSRKQIEYSRQRRDKWAAADLDFLLPQLAVPVVFLFLIFLSGLLCGVSGVMRWIENDGAAEFYRRSTKHCTCPLFG